MNDAHRKEVAAHGATMADLAAALERKEELRCALLNVETHRDVEIARGKALVDERDKALRRVEIIEEEHGYLRNKTVAALERVQEVEVERDEARASLAAALEERDEARKARDAQREARKCTKEDARDWLEVARERGAALATMTEEKQEAEQSEDDALQQVAVAVSAFDTMTEERDEAVYRADTNWMELKQRRSEVVTLRRKLTLDAIEDDSLEKIQSALAAAQERVKELEAQVPHPGDGACDNCGAVPSVDIPTRLCPDCIDDRAERDALQADNTRLREAGQAVIEETFGRRTAAELGDNLFDVLADLDNALHPKDGGPV